MTRGPFGADSPTPRPPRSERVPRALRAFLDGAPAADVRASYERAFGPALFDRLVGGLARRALGRVAADLALALGLR